MFEHITLIGVEHLERFRNKQSLSQVASITMLVMDPEEAQVLNELKALESRKDELSSLERINCNSSPKVMDALLEAVQSCGSLTRVSLIGNGLSRITNGVAKFIREHHHIEELAFHGFDFRDVSMSQLCENMLARSTPLSHLKVDLCTTDEDTTKILSEALPQMLLRQLSFARGMLRVENEVHVLLGCLGLCRELETLTLHIGTEVVTSESVERIRNSIKNMASLKRIRMLWYATLIPLNHCTALGQAFGECPYLEAIELEEANTPPDAQTLDKVAAVIHALGYHPRVQEILLFNEWPLCIEFLELIQSRRAKCLTALVAGATVERVGKRATCWRVSLDVFRRLVEFLPNTD